MAAASLLLYLPLTYAPRCTMPTSPSHISVALKGVERDCSFPAAPLTPLPRTTLCYRYFALPHTTSVALLGVERGRSFPAAPLAPQPTHHAMTSLLWPPTHLLHFWELNVAGALMLLHLPPPLNVMRVSTSTPESMPP